MNSKILKEAGLLVCLIVVVGIMARFIAKGETLSEYAEKNPEAAGISSTTQVESVSDSASMASTEDMAVAAASLNTEDSTESGSAIASTDASDAGAGTDTAATEDPSAVSTTDNSDRVTYMDGFYYEPISNKVFSRISGISYPADCTVPLDDLRYVVLQYIDFDGNSRSGEMICGKAIAQDIVEIFYELYTNDYRIQSIKLIDEYGGDDTASMEANNTSCFNYRVVDNTTRLSKHAYGLAIDLNPFYNPYVTYPGGTIRISPAGSEPYADRDSDFPYKIDENDLAYKLFKAHGFKWGGNWNSVKDYQHFERP